MKTIVIVGAIFALGGCVGAVDSLDFDENSVDVREAIAVTCASSCSPTSADVEQCFGEPDWTACQIGDLHGLCIDQTCDLDAWDAKVGSCSSETDCPVPETWSCHERRCDPSGEKTEPGLPRGCYMEPSAPGTSCSFTKGNVTCPGNCSGSAPTYDCQPLEPHCGGY